MFAVVKGMCFLTLVVVSGGGLLLRFLLVRVGVAVTIVVGGVAASVVDAAFADPT